MAAKLCNPRHLFRGEVQRQYPTQLAFVATVLAQRDCCPFMLEFLEEVGQHSAAKHTDSSVIKIVSFWDLPDSVPAFIR